MCGTSVVIEGPIAVAFILNSVPTVVASKLVLFSAT